MRQLTSFIKKEMIEQLRTGRLLILTILFVMFGIMNPAIAKLTPWLYELFSDSFAEQGIIITETQVDALTSWTQFYKNASMSLIVVVVMFSGILTNELSKGTLVNMLTKGLSRWKVIVAKGITAIVVWTICHWGCFFITYGYNEYFWDNSIASYVYYGGFCIYLFGVWLISLILLGSVLFQSNYAVLLFTGGAVAVSYLIGIVPNTTQYLPIQLMNAGTLLNQMSVPGDYTRSIVVTLILIVFSVGISITVFNRKRI